MTDKKTKKEKPSYEIGYLRHATVDADYNYIELNVKFDPSKIDCKTVVQDTETMVVFARELTATETPTPHLEAAKAAGVRFEKEKKKPKPLPKNVGVPKKPPVKEVGDTEDIKISELQAGDKVNINVRFLKAGDIKRFTKTDGSEGKYCKVDLEDDSGKIKMTLFDEQIELIEGVKENAWLSIENAYCKEYKGTLELSVSYATIESVYNG